MDDRAAPPLLDAILATLARELRRPLDALEAEIDRLLADPDRPITDAQESHTRTMLALCEDLRKMTADCLGGPAPAAKRAPDLG